MKPNHWTDLHPTGTRQRRGVVVLMLCVVMLGMSATMLGLMARRFVGMRKLDSERQSNRRFDAVRNVLKASWLNDETILEFPIDPASQHRIVVKQLDESLTQATEMRGDRTVRQITWNELGESS